MTDRAYNRRVLQKENKASWHVYAALLWFVSSAFIYVGSTNGQTADSMQLGALQSQQKTLTQEQGVIEAEVSARQSIAAVRVRAEALGYVPVQKIVYMPAEHTAVAVR